MDLLDKIGGFVAIRFSMLGHQITDIDLLSFRFPHSARNITHEQIWQQAGVEVAWTNYNGIGPPDCSHGLGTRGNIFWLKAHTYDGRKLSDIFLATCIYLRFVTNSRAIFQVGANHGLRQGYG